MKRKPRRRSTLIGMQSLVDRVRHDQNGQSSDISLVGIWRQAVDHPGLRENARPHRIEQAALIVHVSAPAWAARIRLTTPSLLNALRAAGLEGVNRIDVKVIPEGF